MADKTEMKFFMLCHSAGGSYGGRDIYRQIVCDILYFVAFSDCFICLSDCQMHGRIFKTEEEV